MSNDRSYTAINVAVADQVARIELIREKTRNAFDEVTISELTEAFQLLGESSEVRVIVLTGRGAAFCAGADLNWMRRMASANLEENISDAAGMAKMLQTIAECPKPTLARVQGDAFAGGIGLVAACDIAITADTARYCFSEAKNGLTPATISPYVLRAIGAPS